VARSKITPAAIDRAAGCPVTLRNWRTVQQLAVMSSGAQQSPSLAKLDISDAELNPVG
jgi:hypothetical protein